MAFIIRINDSVIVDGTEFVTFYNDNRLSASFAAFNFDNLEDFLKPRPIDQEYIKYSGYTLNVKSIIFEEAVSNDVMDGYKLVTDLDTNANIIQGYLEMEIFYYQQMIGGLNFYLMPTQEILKLFYWFSKANDITNSAVKLRKIRHEILSKARVLEQFKFASESIEAYEDLLNSTCDFYSELMFASICQMRGIDVTLNKINDFVVNNQIAEVKSIHDDYNRSEFDQTNGLLTKSIPNSYRIADLFDEICTKLLQKKWYDHLSKAIAKQKGKIVFVNATQSPGLGRVSVFIEEHKLQSGIKEMIQKAMDFINKKDVIPVIITTK